MLQISGDVSVWIMPGYPTDVGKLRTGVRRAYLIIGVPENAPRPAIRDRNPNIFGSGTLRTFRQGVDLTHLYGKALQGDVVSSERLRRSPSKTSLRTGIPCHPGMTESARLCIPIRGWKHHRGQHQYRFRWQPSSDAYGKSNLQLKIDNGVEEMNDGRRCKFLSLTTDIFQRELSQSTPRYQVPFRTSSGSSSHHLSSILSSRVSLPLSFGPLPNTPKRCRNSLHYLSHSRR
jgi:hypothetical protein